MENLLQVIPRVILETIKYVKVFSRESIPLYGISQVSTQVGQSVSVFKQPRGPALALDTTVLMIMQLSDLLLHVHVAWECILMISYM